MEELRRELEEAYGFEIHGEEEEGVRTLLLTSRGGYYLFSCPAVHRHKRNFLERARKHVASRLDMELLPVTPTKSGKPYLIVEDQLYYLQPAVREASPPDAPFATGSALAAFHLASAGFQGEQLFQPYRFLGGWPGSWRKKLRRFETFRDDMYAGETEPNRFDEYLLTTFTYVHHLADTAIRYLTDNGYHRIASDAGRLSKISYQNFDDGYILFREDGGVSLAGDWDWVIDMRVRDIGQWIKAKVRRDGWNDSVVGAFLEGYHRVSPLSDEEYAMVYGLMLYPGRFLRLVDLYLELTPEDREDASAQDWLQQVDEELLKTEEALRHYPRLVADALGVAIPTVDWL